LNFDEEFEKFLTEQKRGATGQRLEMLGRNLTGSRLLVKNLLLPVLGSFKGIQLEFELSGPSGVKIFGDVGLPDFRTIVEEDHYVTHAEKITRDRFSFERARARSVAVHGYAYFPYSRDELEKSPEVCQSHLFELLGRIATTDLTGWLNLPVYERELTRCAILRGENFQLSHVSEWLLLKKETCRKVIRKMLDKGLLLPVGGSDIRCYEFRLTEKAVSLATRNRNRIE